MAFKRKILTPSTNLEASVSSSTSTTATQTTSSSQDAITPVISKPVEDDISFFSLAKTSHSALVREQTERYAKQQAEREKKKREQDQLKKKDETSRRKKRKSDGNDDDDSNSQSRRARSTSLTPPPILYPERRKDDEDDIIMLRSSVAEQNAITRSAWSTRNSQRTTSDLSQKTSTSEPDVEYDGFEVMNTRPVDLDPELAYRARQRIAAQQQQKPQTSTISTASPSSKSPSSLVTMTNTTPSTIPSPTQPEPVVELLIISSIPNTLPLVVRRKLTQIFKPVRLAWAARQKLTKQQADNIVLVWRSEIKIYDWQTCQSLKIQALSTTDQVPLNSSSQLQSHDGLEEGTMRPYFEAMYIEDYRKRVADLAAQRQEREMVIASSSNNNNATNDGYDDFDAAGSDADVQIIESPDVTPVKKAKNITVKLKGPGFDLLAVKIKPESTVEELIEKMREERDLGDDVVIKLAFDGEDLEEDMTLIDAEIEDDFLVDVRIS